MVQWRERTPWQQCPCVVCVAWPVAVWCGHWSCGVTSGRVAGQRPSGGCVVCAWVGGALTPFAVVVCRVRLPPLTHCRGLPPPPPPVCHCSGVTDILSLQLLQTRASENVSFAAACHILIQLVRVVKYACQGSFHGPVSGLAPLSGSGIS